jgi:hypothetical protein
VLGQVNPLSYQVSELRGLLIGQGISGWTSALLGILAVAPLLGRLVR